MADQNLEAPTPLSPDKSVKIGAKNKPLKAGRNRGYLLKVLLSPAEAK